MPKPETTAPESASSVTGSLPPPGIHHDVGHKLILSKPERERGASHTSQSSLNTLKIESEAFPRQNSEPTKDALPDGKLRESTESQSVKESSLGMPSQPVSVPHIPVSSLANPTT